MTTVERPPYRIVGTRPIRHDGIDKVTGRAKYANDVQIPGHLHARFLRSPHAHARILSIDTSRAEALPGVFAVVTGKDFPEVSAVLREQTEGAMANMGLLSRHIMARDKAWFRGHAVAAVAADSPHRAEEALKLIDVRYEVLPPVLDALEAMKADAPIVIDGLVTNTSRTTRAGGILGPGEDGPQSNIATTFVMELGDLANGFEEADIILERDYHTTAAHQGYIEPQAATAFWSTDHQLTIWTSTQGPFAVRDNTAAILKLSPGQVKVVPAEIGGGFGAKLNITIEPVAALLAMKCGRPVKLAVSRLEVFEAMGPASPAYVHLRMGITNEGRITAAETKLIFEAGAIPGSPVPGAANCMFSPYNIANGRIEGIDVVVNKPKTLSYRAPGAPSGAYAVEQMLDEFAAMLGKDPIELRLLNAAHEGDRRINGVACGSMGFQETLEAAAATDHYRSPIEGPWRGRGVAAGFWGNATGPASVIAGLLPDGRVSYIEGSVDIGGTRTTAAMMFAEAVGMPVTDVRPSVADTDSIGFTSNTGGSSVTFKQGWAAYEAAQDLKRQLIERAAKTWDVAIDRVRYEAGVCTNLDDETKTLTTKQIAARMNGTGGPIIGHATVVPRGVAGGFAVHIADVEVDPATGKVTLARYSCVQDVGTAIHPSYVEGQMQGGAAQGIGWAINEEYVYNAEGRMENSSFLDYRMPTALDLPPIETHLVEVPNPGHPFGVRGVGEAAFVPPLPAMANAVAHALGTRMYDLPMSPRRVLEALARQ
ncbi:MAG: xanthine dehydrogenase family protein molybdopterin-binding subunit [Dehalococcoidia bacterium]